MTRTWCMALALIAATAVGCAGPGDDDCVGKCDNTNTGWKAALDGRSDPIAAFLRDQSIGDSGEAQLDYGVVVEGLAAVQGCAPSSIRTFVISDDLISGGDAFPRLISTVCTDDNTKAPEFFLAASLREEGSNDVDARTLEMFAWDADARIYRFYETEIMDDKTVKVIVDPERCAGCHRGPANLAAGDMPMTPIMNELTAPWVHWNAEPDFPSHSYDIPESTESSPNFSRYATTHLGAAARLEEIVRAGHSLVAGARARQRRDRPPDVNTAMSLLRPVFCAEQINYATEDFGSGLISASVAVSGGIREAYLQLSATDWPWAWLNDARLRLPSGGDPLFMVPVRGNADLDYEGRLMAVNVLTPHQILRVRALDWKRPVFSELRCNLWKDAMQRFSTDPPALDESWRTSQAMQVLFDEIMKIDGVALAGDSADQVVAVDRAGADTLIDLFIMLDDGSVPTSCTGGTGICKLSLQQFGDMLDVYASAIDRTALTGVRNDALCHIENNVESLPSLPEVSCD